MNASSPARSGAWASKLWRWARSWSARTFATRSCLDVKWPWKAPSVGPASDITAATPRCLVGLLLVVPCSRPVVCIMVVLLYYDRNANPRCSSQGDSDDNGRRTEGGGLEHDMEDRAYADHQGRRRG